MQLEKPSFWQLYKGKILLATSIILLTTFISEPLNKEEFKGKTATANTFLSAKKHDKNNIINNTETFESNKKFESISKVTVLEKFLPTGKKEVINNENSYSQDNKNSDLIASDFQLLKLARTSSKTLSENKELESLKTNNLKNKPFISSAKAKKEEITAPKLIAEMQPTTVKKQPKKKKFSVGIVINLKKGAYKHQETAPQSKKSRVGYFIQQVNNFRNGRKSTFKRVN